MLSAQGLFLITFVGKEGPLKVLPSDSPDHQGTVIGRANQPFTINVQCTDTSTHGDLFGSKLFIDNQEVVGSKTFKRRGNFFGFRKGNGSYGQFVFKIPTFLADDRDANCRDPLLVEKAKQMGQVRIIFFKAFEKWVRPLNPQTRQHSLGSNFVSVPQADCKDIQSRSLSVGIGQQFQPTLPKRPIYQQQGEGGEILVARTDFSSPVDAICLRYSSTPTLLAHKKLDLFSKDHWKYLSPEFIRNNDMVLSALGKQLLQPGRPLEDVKEEMQSLLGIPLSELIEGSADSFLKKLKLKPALTRDDIVEASRGGAFSRFATDPEPKEKPPVDDVEDKNFLTKRPSPAKARPPGPRFPNKG